MDDDESVMSSPRRPLPSLPPLNSTQKPKSLRPLPMGPSGLGDLSEMESSHQSQSRRKRRRKKTPREDSVRRSSEHEGENATPRPRRQQVQVAEEFNDAEHPEDGERERNVPAASARTRRRKKTKSSGSFHNEQMRYDRGIDMDADGGKSFVLATLVPEEDRIKNDEANADNKIRELRSVQPDNDKAVFSEKRNDIYIQTRTGFKRQNTERWLEKRRDVEAQQQRQQDADEMGIEMGKRMNMTVQMALKFIKAFDHITFIFHSLLAGIAIWQVALQSCYLRPD